MRNKSKLANLKLLQFISEKLGDLVHEVIFIGGSTTALLITDENIPDVRFTIDVDCIIDVASLIEYYKLERALITKGFKRSPNESVICRWFYDNAILDIMPTDQNILGFGNPWYKSAIHHSYSYLLENNVSISVISAPYFLATKLTAFNDRGNNDYLASHDFEDIITVIDGRPEIVSEVQMSDNKLKIFLAEEFGKILVNRHFQDALPGHLSFYGEQAEQRSILLVDRIEKMIHG